MLGAFLSRVVALRLMKTTGIPVVKSEALNILEEEVQILEKRYIED